MKTILKPKKIKLPKGISTDAMYIRCWSTTIKLILDKFKKYKIIALVSNPQPITVWDIQACLSSDLTVLEITNRNMDDLVILPTTLLHQFGGYCFLYYHDISDERRALIEYYYNTTKSEYIKSFCKEDELITSIQTFFEYSLCTH